MRQTKIKVGDKYGLLTVIEELPEKDQYNRRLYRCSCECGGTKNVAAFRLLGGDVKSCGCAQKSHRRTPKTEAERAAQILLGAEGVYKRQKDGVWCAQIKIDNQEYHIAAEQTYEAAKTARNEVVAILLSKGKNAAIAEINRRKKFRQKELNEMRRQFGGFPTRAQMAEMRTRIENVTT